MGRSKPAADNIQETLWPCPKCGRTFAHIGQWHSCGRFREVDYLKGKTPQALEIYQALKRAVQACGPVTVSPAKTMISFKLRTTIASVRIKSRSVEGDLLLGERVESKRFARILPASTRCFLHFFSLHAAQEIDSEFKSFLRKACRFALNKHSKKETRAAREAGPIGKQITEALKQKAAVQ